MQPRLASNSGSSCLSLLRAGITGMSHYSRLTTANINIAGSTITQSQVLNSEKQTTMYIVLAHFTRKGQILGLWVLGSLLQLLDPAI
jgi:hypothetical protein